VRVRNEGYDFRPRDISYPNTDTFFDSGRRLRAPGFVTRELEA